MCFMKDLIYSPISDSVMAADLFSDASFQKWFLSLNLFELAFLIEIEIIRNKYRILK